jgi:hypothetical protein
MSDPDFEVTVMSDPDYEDLIAEGLYRDEFCFLVSQEQGFDRLEVKIHPRESGQPWSFSFSRVSGCPHAGKRQTMGPPAEGHVGAQQSPCGDLHECQAPSGVRQ